MTDKLCVVHSYFATVSRWNFSRKSLRGFLNSEICDSERKANCLPLQFNARRTQETINETFNCNATRINSRNYRESSKVGRVPMAAPKLDHENLLRRNIIYGLEKFMLASDFISSPLPSPGVAESENKLQFAETFMAASSRDELESEWAQWEGMLFFNCITSLPLSLSKANGISDSN